MLHLFHNWHIGTLTGTFLFLVECTFRLKYPVCGKPSFTDIMKFGNVYSPIFRLLLCYQYEFPMVFFDIHIAHCYIIYKPMFFYLFGKWLTFQI